MGMFDFSPDDRWFWAFLIGLFAGASGHPFYMIGYNLYWKLKRKFQKPVYPLFNPKIHVIKIEENVKTFGDRKKRRNTKRKLGVIETIKSQPSEK